MRTSKDNLILATVLFAAVAATVVVATEQFGAADPQAAGRRFQSAVGGLGMGPHADLSHCAWQFDPRVTDDDDAGLEALPGIHDYNPWHSMALFPVPSETSRHGLD
ncbi:MAG TPA: hypothetical protein VNH11_03155 [Pirellulales bacterium]|nr:hypothetical protein [Pirellulales bacterium]